MFGQNDSSKSEGVSSDASVTWGYDDDGVYYAKWSFDNHIEYNNELMCIVNKIQDNLADMNAAMNANDFAEAEAVRLQWKKDIQDYKAEANALWYYKGDASFLIATEKYLDAFDDLMDNGYKTLIEMRAAGKRWTPEEQAQLKANNDLMQKLSNDYNADSDSFLFSYDENWELYNSEFDNFAKVSFDESNPLLEPVHWITLEDYACSAYFLSNWFSEDDICKALWVERPIFDEANQIWIKRMQEDQTMAVMSLYSQYFANPTANTKFSSLKKDSWNNSTWEDFVAKIQNDIKFYYEMQWAQQAAYESGLDGAAWLQQNFGISIWDMSSAAMKHMSNTANMAQMMTHMEAKKHEYLKEFAKQGGWNIADDVEF